MGTELEILLIVLVVTGVAFGMWGGSIMQAKGGSFGAGFLMGLVLQALGIVIAHLTPASMEHRIREQHAINLALSENPDQPRTTASELPSAGNQPAPSRVPTFPDETIMESRSRRRLRESGWPEALHAGNEELDDLTDDEIVEIIREHQRKLQEERERARQRALEERRAQEAAQEAAKKRWQAQAKRRKRIEALVKRERLTRPQ